MATKYYAVQQGRKKGVFSTWAECQQQVTGYKGAVFKSFQTLQEAEAFAYGAKAEADMEFEKDALIAYVDGSYLHASREFAYGMVILDGTEELHFCEKFSDKALASMRNVAGEIKGAEAAMRYAVSKGAQKLYIFHDYEGIAKWCQGIWKTNKEGTKAYKAYFDSVKEQVEIVFVKVAAHTGNHYNELADELAKRALGIEKMG